MTDPQVTGQPGQTLNERLVVVPARPGAGPGELELEARQQPRGVVLPVFSSVRALIGALGESQPWALMPLGKAGDFAAAGGVDQIVLDPDVTADAWKWRPDEAAGLTWDIDGTEENR